MITLAQYFGNKPHSPDHTSNADYLLHRVANLEAEAAAAGVKVDHIDPDTGTCISGSRGGAGDGGFRLPTSTTGKGLSSHKEARGVDKYDPLNELDNWLTDEILARHGLYREHPDDTPTWCHLTTRPPNSGKRSFHI